MLVVYAIYRARSIYLCHIPQEAKSKSNQFSLGSVVFKIHLTRRPTKAQFTKINTTFIIGNPLLTKVMDIISKLLLITLSQFIMRINELNIIGISRNFSKLPLYV